MATITIWSDLLCPWAYVAALRLHQTRDHMRAESVTFDFRAWPRELAEGRPPSKATGRNEMAALAQLEHRAFSSYDSPTWPTTSLLAFETQKWGYSFGQDIGERFDLALRRAVFLHSHDVALRNELMAVAEREGLELPSLAAALDSARYRAAVIEDFAAAEDAGVDDSPRIDLPDGESHTNPGITYEVVRGIPIITGDHPSVYEEMIRIAATDD